MSPRNPRMYVCPKHDDVVLYTEGPTVDKKMIERVEEIRECKKCDKMYYRWECKEIEVEPG